MSGVAVIVAKLKAYSALTAVVPAARIMAGELPEGTAAPAIGVMQVSSVPRVIVSPNGKRRSHVDRVQVTVLVAGKQTAAGTGYAGLRAIQALLMKACPQTRGTVNTINCDSIIPDTAGPDFPVSDPSLIAGSRDFMVRWNEPA